MRHRWREMPLPIAFGLALLLHGAAVLVVAPGITNDAAGSTTPRALLDPDAIMPPEPDPDEIQLGIDAPTPSSMTWIGYDTYLEHLARLSTVEQAEFEDDAGEMSGDDTPASDAAPGATVAAATPPTETVPEQPTDAEAATPADAPDAMAAANEPIDLPLPVVSELEEQTVPGVSEAPDAAPSVVGPVAPPADAQDGTVVQALTADEFEAIANALMPGLTEISPRPRSASVADPARSEAEETMVTRAGEGSNDAAAQTPQPESSAAPAAATPGASGDSDSVEASPAPSRRAESTGAARAGEGRESDRESIATSIVEVPISHLRSGRPLASHGLEIRTRNPVFPVLTSVTAAPRNPLVEIHFGHDGRPRHAGLLESSGDPRVDGPIVDSLYRWRASGEALADLDPEEVRSTVRIRMRILLGNR